MNCAWILCMYTKLYFIGKKCLRSAGKYCILRSHRDWKRSEMHTKEQWSRNEFCWLRFFFVSAMRKKLSVFDSAGDG